MLVKFEDKVGIAVESWLIKKEAVYFVLTPLEHNGHHYVEVDAVHGNQMEIVSERLPSWGMFKRDRFGYPEAQKYTDDLYWVWDDGATVHSDKSIRLYGYFKNIINHYANKAIETLAEIDEDKYQGQIAEAKANGWDWLMIERPSRTFPYNAKES